MSMYYKEKRVQIRPLDRDVLDTILKTKLLFHMGGADDHL